MSRALAVRGPSGAVAALAFAVSVLALPGLPGWLAVPDRPALMVLAVSVAVTALIPLVDGEGDPIPLPLAVIGAAALIGFGTLPCLVLGAVGVLARRLRERVSVADGLGLELLWSVTAPGAAAIGATTIPAWTLTRSGEIGGLEAAFVGLLLVVGLPTYLGVVEERKVTLRGLGDQIVRRSPVTVALASTAVTAALAHTALGGWAVPLTLLPLLVARLGLRKYGEVRRTYDETLVAMSRLPETFGPIPDGHAHRVAIESGQAARRLGLPPELIRDIERAAHLHEVGRITLEHGETLDRVRVAAAGGAIIREAQVGGAVEEIVMSFGATDDATREEIRLAGRIITLCCELDLITDAPLEFDVETIGSFKADDPLTLQVLDALDEPKAYTSP